MKFIVNSKELPDELKPQKAADAHTEGTTSITERSVDYGGKSERDKSIVGDVTPTS